MATPTIRQEVQTARTALAAKRAETARKLFAREQARLALAEALRQFAADSMPAQQAQAAFAMSQSNLATARQQEGDARIALNAAIKKWLSDSVSGNALDPDAELSRFDRRDVPLTLFPLRLETRFDIAQRTLRVRIYPDEFYSNIHEKELLPEEQATGAAYWDNLPPEGEVVGRWTALAARFGVARAAYIVRATDLSNPAGLPPPRATSPSRAAEAVLPDRWTVLAYRDGRLQQKRSGLPIPEPLTLTPDPSNDVPAAIDVADGFTVPSEIAWTVRYDRARDQGMAIDVDQLTDEDLARGFDRLIVFGVKTSMDPVEATAWMADQLDGHHFTRGLSMLAQGTATNNVAGRPTPFTAVDPPGAKSFFIERSFGGEAGTGDFTNLNYSFGFAGSNPKEIFTFIPGGQNDDRVQQDDFYESSMNTALWPATIGYFLKQLMNPWAVLDSQNAAGAFFSDQLIETAKDFFTTKVAGHGPLPAFRVGAVPYGVLPALSLSRWQALSGEDQTFVNTMARALPYWQEAAKKVPAVTPASADANLDLMKVISQQASSDAVFIRNSLGPQAVTGLWQLLAMEIGKVFAAQRNITGPVVESLGHPEWAKSRVAALTFSKASSKYAGALVTAKPLNGKLASLDPDHPDGPSYLRKLADVTLTLAEIETQDGLAAAGPAGELKPLLYLLLRHAYLLECVRIARIKRPDLFPRHVELEHWGISTAVVPHPSLPWLEVLKAPDIAQPSKSVFQVVTATSEFSPFRIAIGSLADADLPVRDLERLLTGTLDLCSNRLDAWITALAFRRINQHRKAEQAVLDQTNYIGGYGWVEDVRPVARGTRTVPNLGSVDVQPGNGGFIHAPSMQHATAAAILRSGRMSEKKDPTKYAIELPSERTRRAIRLMDGLRAGQHLGALLGYEVEHGLRARKVPGTEGFIQALRKLFPLVANKSSLDGTDPTDRIAAPNVVDGQSLRRAAAASGPGIPFNSGGLPPKGSPGEIAISAEIARLDEIMDGISDLTISESIFQIAGGDTLTAQATMSFLPEGGNPPEPELTQTQPAGLSVSHRVALLLEGTTAPASAGWAVGSTPRGQADPFVDAWVGSLLGDASKLPVKIDYQKANVPKTASLDLSQLGLGGLDFLAVAQGTAQAGQGSALDRRLKAAFLAQQPPADRPTITDVVISYGAVQPPGRTVPQVLELARSIGTLLGSARELRAADLRRAGDGIDDTLIDPAAVVTKATGAVTALGSALAAMDGADRNAALTGSALYIADTFPDADAGDVDLQTAVAGAKAELGRRLKDAQTALVAATGSGSSNAAKLEAAVAALRIVFGRNTLVVMPAAVPQGGGEIGQSLTALARPANFTTPSLIEAHQAPARFLHQVMRVREKLSPWRRFSLYAGALGVKPPALSVAQLPFVAGEAWAGRSAPSEGRQSLLFLAAGGQTDAPNPLKVWRGLLLDEWTELVPGAKVQTGIAFHYDGPGAEAPQAILMCANSDLSNWNLAEVTAILNETIDLARVRPVDSDLLAVGQLLPAICLATNPANRTISTTFGAGARLPAPVVVG